MSTTQTTQVRVKTRVQNKYDTKENFDKASFVPLKGEIVFYDTDGTLPNRKMKVGDGQTPIGDLPFVDLPQGNTPTPHNHNDTYYTESEVDAKVTISGTVTKDIGGISKNTTYTDAALVDVLTDLLFPYVAFTFSGISTSESSGTLEYGTTRTITSVTPSFTLGSKPITSINIGTTAGGSDLYSGTSATSGTAITLSAPRTYDGTTGGTIHCTISDGTTSIPKSASVSYTYYNYTAVTSSTTPPTTASSASNRGTSVQADIETTDNTYIWFLMPNQNKTQIQQYAMNQWNNMNTTYAGTVEFTTSTNKQVTYHAYRTDKMMSSDETYRIN